MESKIHCLNLGRGMMMRRLISILLVITMAVTLCACGADDVTDQVANIVQAEDEHVLGVKGGTPNAYPGKTYGETFDNFFGSPTWKYFVGTKEGADEDGDGEPDYIEENVDIVEFTGYCTYQDVEVKALIQFTLSKDDNTFEATYLSFNDVPQNMLMLSALLDAAFTNENMDDTVENNSGETVQENGSQDYAAEFVGMWWDTYSQRCNMEISSDDGVNYYIDINWGSSAWENTHWSFYGTYSDETGGIHYYGSRIEELYFDDGTMQETYAYSDGEGFIWIGDDGMLYWDDYVEQQGRDCAFEKSTY